MKKSDYNKEINLICFENQRTSDPVNAHLTPGPGIYFNALIHVYSPSAGADNPLGTNADDNRKPLQLCPFVASFKTISMKYDFKHILNDFIHVYSHRVGTDNPFGTKFWCQQKALITLPIRCKFKKRNLILYTFLMILYMYIAPGQGQITPWGQTFDVNRKPLSFCPFVAGLKKIALKSDFIYIFFHVSPYVYSPGQGKTFQWGQNFDDNRKAFSLCPYVASFKMISSKSDFKHIFNDFIHVYSPGPRAEDPLGTNFWGQQKALITSTICCNFQTNLFEFWFYTQFLMFFHMYIAHGQGQTTLCGQNPDVNRKALSLCPLLQVSKKYLWSLILYIIFHVFIHAYSRGRGRQPLGVRIFI